MRATSLPVLLLVLPLVAACGTVLEPTASTCAPPVFSMPSGTYQYSFSVAMASATPWAQVRYTTDGSTPSRVHGTLYAADGQARVTGTTADVRLRAVAFCDGFADSPVVEAVYSLRGAWEIVGDAPVPSLDPAVGADSFSMCEYLGGPCVAFVGNTGTMAILVRRWDGTAWQDLGSPGTAYNSANLSIAATNDTLYIAYQDVTPPNDIVVKRRTSASGWTAVGTLESSFCNIWIQILVAGDGNPVVGYMQPDSSLHVLKFDGVSAWGDLGLIKQGNTDEPPRLACSGSTLALVYRENSTVLHSFLVCHAWTNWAYLGASGFTSDTPAGLTYGNGTWQLAVKSGSYISNLRWDGGLSNWNPGAEAAPPLDPTTGTESLVWMRGAAWFGAQFNQAGSPTVGVFRQSAAGSWTNAGPSGFQRVTGTSSLQLAAGVRRLYAAHLGSDPAGKHIYVYAYEP